MTSPFPVKTALTLATLAVFLSVPQLVPALANYRSLDWREVPRVLDFVPRRPALDPVAEESLRSRPSLETTAAARHQLFDPAQSLDHYYETLRRVELREPGATVRILHYGDSPTTADLITADARSMLQRQFGDAGHGFYLIAKPWAWYGHRGIDSSAQGWTIDAANQSETHDGIYGLGGVSFTGAAGASARIRLRGADHSAVEVAFARASAEGAFAVIAEAPVLGTIDASGPDKQADFARFSLPPGASSVEIRVTSGRVRLFGVNLERGGPGVMYSSLGLNGAYTSVLARLFSERHWRDQLQHYQPDLVIINYGTNESVYPVYVDQVLPKETREVIRRIRAALPTVSILLMSPMDRGQKGTAGEIATVPVLPRLVKMQAQIALDQRCAFFNTFEAMGGEGTMAKWYQAEPRLVGGDFIHPMPAGAKIVGNLLHTALLDGYNRYKLREMQKRLAQPASPEKSR